jgi:release factor glutamine methyltransferase
MPTARALIADATNRLTSVGIASPVNDATELLAHVLRTPRGRVLLQDEVGQEEARAFERLIIKRMGRTPLQHLTGIAGFRHLELLVGPGVFVPRPETEVLTEIAIREVRSLRESGVDPVVVDLCSGSGAIALAVATECDGVQVHAVEISEDALPWTHRNALAHDTLIEQRGSRVTVHGADATTVAHGALASLLGRVHVVVSNPPYIPDAATPTEPEVALHDPRPALYGGRDGLDVVRALLPGAHDLLVPGGLIAIEHADVQGDGDGVHGVPAVLRASGLWEDVADHDDLAGRPRVTTARRGH